MKTRLLAYGFSDPPHKKMHVFSSEPETKTAIEKEISKLPASISVALYFPNSKTINYSSLGKWHWSKPDNRIFFALTDEEYPEELVEQLMRVY